MPTSTYTFQILIQGGEAIAAAKQIRAALEKELSQGFGQAKQQMADVSNLTQSAGANMGIMAGQLKGVTGESGRLELDLRNADDATRQMVSSLVRTEAGARQLEAALRGGEQAASQTRQQVKWLGYDLEKVAKMGRIERFGAALNVATTQTYGMRMLASELGRVGTGMMMAGTAIIGPLTLAGRSYLEFAEDANRAARQLKLNTELTGYLKDETLDLSASLGLFTPEEINKGLYTWASAMGAVAESQKDINTLLENSTEIQKLAALNQEELGSTTTFVAAILGEFGMDISQTSRTIAALNYTADRTQATVGDLGESFKFIGPIAASLGEDIESVAAAMGVAADAGIKGSMSGRALRQLFIRLVDPTKEMNQAFDQALGLNEELGQTWQDMAFPGGKFIGLANFIDLVAAATENMTDQQRQALLAQMATANELPVLTALVTKQIEARKEGINVLRAEEKIMTGTIDAEVRKYAEWKEATKGVQVSLESARDSWEREWQMYEESDVARANRMQKRWDAAWKRIGEEVVETALPTVEKIVSLLDQISRYAEEHPEMVGTALTAGGVLVGFGALTKAVSSGIRLYADVKMITAAATMYAASSNMLKAAGIQAAQQVTQTAAAGVQTAAAGTQVTAAETQLAAAQTQAVGSTNLLAVTGSLGVVAAAFAGLMYAAEKAGIPKFTQTELAFEGEEYADYVKAIQRAAQHPVKMLTEEQWEQVRAGKDLREVIAETNQETEDWRKDLQDCTDEMNDLKRHLREGGQEARNLGNDLAQLPPSVAAFTEEELQAIDELEDYLRKRNEMVEKQNEELENMMAEFQDQEKEHYQDYLKERAKLEKELAEVTEEPLWQQSEDYVKAQEKIAKATEEYNKQKAEAQEEYNRKIRDLAEDHSDKMEDLEATRDAKGIIQERRRYDRAKRDAGEQYQDTLASLKEKLDETVEEETIAIAKVREERRKDVEDKLAELDAEYVEEATKRQADFQKRYSEKQVQNQQELQQLEQAHAQRLAAIMGWEQKVRDAVRSSYTGKEEDLRQHLTEMEQMYYEYYNAVSLMAEQAAAGEQVGYEGIHAQAGKGKQAGGYAGPGLFRLGEAGREFVLSAPTTHAIERAIGPLTQARLMAMAHTYNCLDIRVSADQHFSPEFAAQTEAAVRAEVVRLTRNATGKSLAYRVN